MAALGDLATVDHLHARRAERALRYAIAELKGTGAGRVYQPGGG